MLLPIREYTNEKPLCNQMDRITGPADINLPLSLAILVLTKWIQDNSGHSGMDGSNAWAYNMDFPSV